MDAERTEQLLALERRRCDLIVKQDFEGLRDLLSPDLIHTHTRGNQDSRDSYLHYLAKRVEILDLKREGLKVQWAGPSTGIMHGKQSNRARLRGATEEISVEAQVIQVWTLEADGSWRQLAFQATPLGSPPPVVAR